jgi:DNA-binding NtrC family response regulator
MHGSLVLLFSQDQEGATRLRRLLESQRGLKVEHVGYKNGKPAAKAQARPPLRAVFVDLRPGALDDSGLQAVRELGLERRRDVWVVALVNGGYPRELAVWADAVVHEWLEWPTDQRCIQRIVQRFSGPPPSCFANVEARTLRGKTVSFTTREPELFPMLEDLELVAKHDVTVLLIGETGTGKTHLAKLIHELSPRAEEKFLPVACGTLPADLIESELFGHVKGAFTGADRTKTGRLESVGRGTFLLDEIDVLGLDQQAKLLRVLETGEFEPVGSNETRKLRGRAIVASNLDLETLVANDRFRSDLYYRLNEVKFYLPPLRRRQQDIVPLAIEFIEFFSNHHRIAVRRVHPEFLERLKAYHWPGNIRELMNQMRRAVMFCRSGELTPDDMAPAVTQSITAAPVGPPTQPASDLPTQVALTEQAMIEQMLKQHNFNRAATARALGISRVTLYNKLKKYDMF